MLNNTGKAVKSKEPHIGIPKISNSVSRWHWFEYTLKQDQNNHKIVSQPMKSFQKDTVVNGIEFNNPNLNPIRTKKDTFPWLTPQF